MEKWSLIYPLLSRAVKRYDDKLNSYCRILELLRKAEQGRENIDLTLQESRSRQDLLDAEKDVLKLAKDLVESVEG